MEEKQVTENPEIPDVAETPEISDSQLEPETEKKGPGRPKKDTVQTPDNVVIPRKEKGKKSKEKTESGTNKTAEFFARQVSGVHQLITVLTGIDLTIPGESAQQLGEAIFDVVKSYDMEWLSKYSPVINLAVTAVIVEAPVILKARVILAQKKAEKREQKTLQKPVQEIEAGDPLTQAGGLI